jgi:prepilin signal peptidase PulO-like enzyme (type II secretory pathway)
LFSAAATCDCVAKTQTFRWVTVGLLLLACVMLLAAAWRWPTRRNAAALTAAILGVLGLGVALTHVGGDHPLVAIAIAAVAMVGILGVSAGRAAVRSAPESG